MIKNYIFDFGDVFINLDKSASVKELEKLGLAEFTDEMIVKNQQYEKGLITTDVFIAFYQTQFPKANKQELIDAWNAILLDFPLYRLEFIEEFSKNNHCHLLSNINDLHLIYIKNMLGKEFYNRFLACFDNVFYSHEIKLRKPDISIYNYVFKEINAKANTCFFIDDTQENTIAAENLGLKSWNINPMEDDIILLNDILEFNKIYSQS
ncbi:MAG: HAD-IA family hydrolase [Flavobacteriaceae bacterium]